MNTPQLLVSNSVDNQLQMTLLQLKTQVNWEDISIPDADVTVINKDGEGIKIAEIRQLLADSSFKPYARAERAVLILNLEQASIPAQQALLKFLEEPPNYVRVIASTTNITAVLPTIQSRCQIQYLAQKQPTIPDEVTQWIEKLPTASYADIIAISATYKDKNQAITFIEHCLIATKKSTAYPSRFTIESAQQMMKTSTNLHANANTRLSIENCFFTIKDRF